jgi:hypothetical protein
VTELSATTPIGQPALEAALEKLAEEILGTIVEGAFCAVQDWDHRIDCCIRLGEGRTVGEMVPLSTLDGQVLRPVGERLRRRKQDEGFEFRNELPASNLNLAFALIVLVPRMAKSHGFAVTGPRYMIAKT